MLVQLAKRLMDLQFLPHIVVINPHIKQVYDSYRQAFGMLTAFIGVALLSLVDDHTPLLIVLAQGVRECSPKALVDDHTPLVVVLARRLVNDHTHLLGVLARGVSGGSLRPLAGRELTLNSLLLFPSHSAGTGGEGVLSAAAGGETA
ncbi:unnamed protein product [Closterium sp. NIES-64]|nr:unnamed protein product [Closterium sp. NIES-64]